MLRRCIRNRQTFSRKLSVQTSLVLWVRVMASLRWAVQCYCRITERLIETNDSNNGTLSPQAGFVVSLISVAAKAMRTSHHPDPSKGSCQGSFKVAKMRLSCSRCVTELKVAFLFFFTLLVNIYSQPLSGLRFQFRQICTFSVLQPTLTGPPRKDFRSGKLSRLLGFNLQQKVFFLKVFIAFILGDIN